MLKNRNKGSVTVEAAVFLPIFVIAIMSFVFTIKVYYTNEIVQHAISGACNEMSVYSLLYYQTNAEEVIGGIEKFSQSEQISEMFGDTKVLSYVQHLGKEATDYVRAQAALVPITKYLVKKNLNLGVSDNADARLKGLNLKEGFEAIDFSKSRMLSDGKSIDIIAEYELEFPFLSSVLPGIKITQVASSRIWAGEEGVNTGEANDESTSSVWDMSNIKRGREIRKLQGANLPFNFPAISNFENGVATSIHSLNIDETYYHTSKNLKQKLLTLINKLEAFNGAQSGKVSVDNHEIFIRELRIILPETEVLAHQQQTLEECRLIANSKGIELKIIKAYGKQSSTNEVEDDKSDK